MSTQVAFNGGSLEVTADNIVFGPPQTVIDSLTPEQYQSMVEAWLANVNIFEAFCIPRQGKSAMSQ